MMVLVSYDVDTSTPDGTTRLRKVARICESFGVRVQNSVFEVIVDPAQYADLKSRLGGIVDMKTDSIRFYRLGSNWKPKIESLGRALAFDPGEDIFL